MGYIHCCGALHKTRSFMLAPKDGFLICEIDVLKQCPVCGHFVVQLTRIGCDNEVSAVRYTNKKAKNFFDKLKTKILYEEKFYDYSNIPHSKFYLNYNEFGVKKRCYSNFSSLKLGKF